jgi:hypothetical protein
VSVKCRTATMPPCRQSSTVGDISTANTADTSTSSGGGGGGGGGSGGGGGCNGGVRDRARS